MREALPLPLVPCRFYDPQMGAIIIDGQNIADVTQVGVARGRPPACRLTQGSLVALADSPQLAAAGAPRGPSVSGAPCAATSPLSDCLVTSSRCSAPAGLAAGPDRGGASGHGGWFKRAGGRVGG